MVAKIVEYLFESNKAVERYFLALNRGLGWGEYLGRDDGKLISSESKQWSNSRI
jgi:hypothetical protein